MSISDTDAAGRLIDPDASITRLNEDAENAQNQERSRDENLTPVLVNPFASDPVEERIGGPDKPFLQTFIEGLCVMFWDADYRRTWMQQNNIDFGRDHMQEMTTERSQVNLGPQATPMSGGTLARAPSLSDNAAIVATYGAADRLYGQTLDNASRAFNAQFSNSAAGQGEIAVNSETQHARDLDTAPTAPGLA